MGGVFGQERDLFAGAGGRPSVWARMKPPVAKLFTTMHFMVRFRTGWWTDPQGKTVEVPPGSVVVSYPRLSEVSGLSVSQVRTGLHKLASGRHIYITRLSRRHNMFTLVNWAQTVIGSEAERAARDSIRSKPRPQRVRPEQSEMFSKFDPSDSTHSEKSQQDDSNRKLLEKPGNTQPGQIENLTGYRMAAEVQPEDSDHGRKTDHT
jgi:hypothetical protein